jgi:arylsulfatase A-like enzyme
MAAPDAGRRPNVVVVIADDLGVGDVGCYHPASKVPTPHIDRLAGAGVRFTDAHAASAVCTPSRYALLTGRYAWRTHLQRGVLSGYAPPLIEPDVPTLASVLRDAGYRTLCVGKWHLGMGFSALPGETIDFARAPYSDPDLEARIDFTARLSGGPLGAGFDRFFGTAGCPTCHAPYAFIEDDRFPVPASDYDDAPVYTSRSGACAPGWSHRDVDVAFAERAVAWIEEAAAADAPFFLYLAASAPHEPCVDELVPPFARGRSGAGPRGDLAWLYDWMVGQVLDALERSGADRDTLVVVTSDHGALPGDRVLGPDGEVLRDEDGEEAYRTYGHDPSGGWRGSKAHVWEGGHRVPLVVRAPGDAGPGRVEGRLVSLLDLLPTVASLAGVPLPAGAAPDGVGFASALADGAPSGGAALADGREHLVLHSEAGVFALRAGRWKLIEGTEGSGGWPPPEGGPPVPGAPGQLYDLEADPQERWNRFAERPDVVARLQALLDEERARGTPGG